MAPVHQPELVEATEAAQQAGDGNSAGEIVELRPDADEHFDLPANA